MVLVDVYRIDGRVQLEVDSEDNAEARKIVNDMIKEKGYENFIWASPDRDYIIVTYNKEKK
jgi:hypothetical protein